MTRSLVTRNAPGGVELGNDAGADINDFEVFGRIVDRKVKRGINLTGGSDYDAFWSFPTTAEIRWAKRQGFDVVRVPYRWERLQPTLGGAFDAGHQTALDNVVREIVAQGMIAQPVAHNFGGRVVVGGTGAIGAPEVKIGTASLTHAHWEDFCLRLGGLWDDISDSVWLDLMNEPESLPLNGYATTTDHLVAIYNKGIVQVRAAGFTGRIVLEGNGYNNAQFFDTNPWYNAGSTPPTSADAFHAGIVDSGNNWIASVHNYPEPDHGDDTSPIANARTLRTRMDNVLAWCTSTGRTVIVGEFGVNPNDQYGEAVARDFLQLAIENADKIEAVVWWEGRGDAETTAFYNIATDVVPVDERIAWFKDLDEQVEADPSFAPPAAYELTGWWPAPYPGPGTDWLGGDSAGPSGSRDIPSSVANPTVSGTQLNGFDVANNGTGLRAVPPGTLGDYLGTSVSGWSFAMLVNVTTLSASGGVRYAEPALFTSAGGYLGVAASAAGFGVWQYDTGGGTYVDALTPASASTWTLVQARWTGTAIEIRTNGGSWTSSALASRYVADDASATFIGQDYSGNSLDADIVEPLFVARSLSDVEFDEVWAYYETRFALGGAPAASLTAATGTFALTGNAANTLLARRIVADTGSFALTGVAANLLDGKRIAADTGSFSLTGNAANTLIGRRLAADTGAFTLTGNAAGTLAGRAVAADNSSFTLTGVDATLVYTVARTLTADVGTFALTGVAAGTTVARRLVADPASLALTGTATNLLDGKLVTADVASFSLTGNAAATTVGRRVAADVGTFSLTGNAAGVTAGRRLSADTSSLALTGNAATLTKVGASAIDAAVGAFTLTGNAAGTIVARRLVADASAIALTGVDAGLRAARRVSADVGGFALAGVDAGTRAGRNMLAVTSSFALTGVAASLLRGVRLGADEAAFALTGIDAALVYVPLNFYTMVSDGGAFVLVGNDVDLLIPSSALPVVDVAASGSASLAKLVAAESSVGGILGGGESVVARTRPGLSASRDVRRRA